MQIAGHLDVFHAIASPIRRQLLDVLRHGEVPATLLADRFDVTQPAISQQLRVLREAGLVTERRLGRQRLYRLEAAPLVQVADWVRAYERFWTDRLDMLGALLDEMAERPPAPTRRRAKAPAGRARKG